MKKIVSFLLSFTISISTILIFAGNIYSVKAEEISINSFIENGVNLIRENDAGKVFVTEDITDNVANIAEKNSFSKKFAPKSVETQTIEEFSDTAFQTCRLIIKASKAPDELNSTGMASGFKDWYIIQFKNENDAKKAYRKYSTEETIQSVFPDMVVEMLLDAENDETTIEAESDGNIARLNSWGSIETGLYDVKDYIENNVSNKREIVVGVIDTGIEKNHPFFDDRIIRYCDAYMEGYEHNDIYHGTQVSATIVDNTNDNIKIALYQYSQDNSKSAWTSVWLCFLKAIKDNVDVINCSFGVIDAFSLYEMWEDAIEYANNKDVVVFAAAGNTPENICWMPAMSESVYTVAAYGPNGLPCSWTSYGKEVDFLAPGENIPTIYMEGYNQPGETETGTSFSCPLTVSEFALLMTLFPDKSNKQIIDLMKRTCKLTDAIYDYALYGCGVIDAIGASGIERNKKPQFNLPEGKYIGETKVEIKAEPGCDVYYTLDGSYPSKENGILYTSPISLSDGAYLLKAVVYGNGLLQSECAKSCYRIQHIGTDDMFKISDDGQITEYTGNMCDLIIPETIKGITVTGIASSDVFNNLTGVTFPNTMTEVPGWAFRNNANLKLADGYRIELIGEGAFENCKNLCHISFPSAKEVGSNSFKDDSALEEVILPMCVKINNYSFLNCKSIRCVSLPKIEYINPESFRGCEWIWDIDISNVSNITERIIGGAKTFYDSKVLMPLDLPNLKRVTRRVFYFGFFSRIEFSNVEEITSITGDSSGLLSTESLVLPATLVNCNIIGLVETAVIYGSKGTYAEQWANENGFEFIEISPETAIINDLPYEFYDNMHYLYADVVGFNRTYQWYGSYFDRNTGGIPIEGANERKFVPKENDQYPYYYCVVTSTDVGYDPIEIRTGSSRYMEFNGEMPNADYSALDDILATVPEDLSIYTDESVAALNEIINNIDRNLDVSNQTTVDGYVEAISNSLSALKLKEHMVSFAVDNESVLSYELEYGSEITDIPPNPDKTGYTFSKWTPDIPPAMPNNSLTFTAKFEPITYYASFMVDGEEIEKVPFTVESTSISEPDVPIKTGYTGKWSEYIIAASNITINAEYSINDYTVSFVADDKTIKSETVKYGSPIEVPDNPQKDGYIFKEWLPKVPETMPAKDMTFYAVFEKIQDPIVTTSISINKYVNVRTVDYKTTITFTALTDSMPTGATIVWYINGQKSGEGEMFTVKEAKEAFTVQAKIVDKSGNTLDSTETELVKVKADFFSRIIAFFRMLFGKLPIVEQ